MGTLDELEIRRASDEDIRAVIDLAVDLVITSKSPHREGVTDEALRVLRRENFARLDSILEMPEGGLFVAKAADGSHVGHVLLLGNQVDPVAEIPQAWVYDISVRRDWWGKGVGRLLMERAEDFAKGLGLHYVGLRVTAANRRAVEFYEELGYRVERVAMVKSI